jgi:DNA repair photolyase
MKNMYKFVDIRWNPVKGKCLFNCSYCYVGRWGTTQKPTHLDKKELYRNLGRGNFIFVCSGCDLFHPSVSWELIAKVFRSARDRYQDNNTYMWHTKNPGRALEIPIWQYPEKSVLCVTVETDIHMAQISAAPAPTDRIKALKQFKGEKMITIEPIMDFNLDRFLQMILEAAPAQVNIGADSGHNRLPEPSAEKIVALINALKPHAIVHLKDNINRIMKETE